MKQNDIDKQILKISTMIANNSNVYSHCLAEEVQKLDDMVTDEGSFIGSMSLEDLKKLREENFKKIGQSLLQKMYYEEEVEELLMQQKKVCNDIFKLEREDNG